jgi:hypothetical protein
VAAPRPSRERILVELRRAARRGDEQALALALDQMRTLALTPRYWRKYLDLLENPLARLVDLLVLKQGSRLARQKGWKLPAASRPRPEPPGPGPRSPRKRPAAPAPATAPAGPGRAKGEGGQDRPRRGPGRRRPEGDAQPSLF